VPPALNRLLEIAVLLAATASTGCAVTEQFAPANSAACRCREDTCSQSRSSCEAAAALELNAMSQIRYPQQFSGAADILPPAEESHADLFPAEQILPQPTDNLSCDAQVQEVRQNFSKQLISLEQQFEEQRRENDVMSSQLLTLNGNVERLSEDVDYWKNELSRIARRGDLNHRKNVEQLQAISELLDEITPGTETAPEEQTTGIQTQ
jgi:hypothetical protein